ncbi:MAG: 30S ribosomal protein S20 [Candidatus Babeliaceae bacterium]|nr:30S ribosomal protein S20 [Candidatus Babeliaceae bacterium]
MANTKSAKKSAVQNKVRAQRNLARRTAIKTATKKVMLAVEAGSNEQEIEKLLKDVAAKLYRARGKNIIHKNTAARKLSRLSKHVAKAAKSASK